VYIINFSDHLTIPVPLGTIFKTRPVDGSIGLTKTLADLNEPSQFFIGAKGGAGGKGNKVVYFFCIVSVHYLKYRLVFSGLQQHKIKVQKLQNLVERGNQKVILWKWQ
jgi:hypothetical protein